MWCRTAALLALVAVLPLAAGSIRGLDPALAPRYQPGADGKFACLDGKKTIPFAQVNDDYCDCLDSSDEPGTSACANGHFYCENKFFLPLRLNSSMVDDGVCDCCDGSDEAAGRCANTCYEKGAESLIDLKQQVAAAKMGVAARDAYMQDAEVAKEQWAKRKDDLAGEIEAARKEKEAADAKKARLEEQQNKLRERKNELEQQRKKLEEEAAPPKPPAQPGAAEGAGEQAGEGQEGAAQEAAAAEEGQEGHAASEEGEQGREGEAAKSEEELAKERMAQWIPGAKDKDQPAGTGDEEEAAASAGVEEDAALPAYEGEDLAAADAEAEAAEAEQAAADAEAAAAEAAAGGEEDEEQFFLDGEDAGGDGGSAGGDGSGSSGDGLGEAKEEAGAPGADAAEGWKGHAAVAFALDQAKGLLSALDDIKRRIIIISRLISGVYDLSIFEEGGPDGGPKGPPPAPGALKLSAKIRKLEKDLAALEKVLSPARTLSTQAQSKLSQKESEQSDLEAKLAHAYGEKDVFVPLAEKCFSAKVDKYTYEVCPFDKASQKEGHSSTSLGSWSGLEEGDSVMAFRNGQSCWQGPSRSMTVFLRCGESEKLTNVQEPSRCEYTAQLETPAACTRDSLEALQAELAARERQLSGVQDDSSAPAAEAGAGPGDEPRDEL